MYGFEQRCHILYNGEDMDVTFGPPKELAPNEKITFKIPFPLPCTDCLPRSSLLRRLCLKCFFLIGCFPLSFVSNRAFAVLFPLSAACPWRNAALKQRNKHYLHKLDLTQTKRHLRGTNLLRHVAHAAHLPHQSFSICSLHKFLGLLISIITWAFFSFGGRTGSWTFIGCRTAEPKHQISCVIVCTQVAWFRCK